MKACRYEYSDKFYKFKCNEESLHGSDYCILHTRFPEDENSHDYHVLLEEKNKKIKEKVENDDFNFWGAKLPELNFDGMNIEGDLTFRGATINRYASFRGTTIKGYANFDFSIIDGTVNFEGATIDEYVFFDGAKVKGYAFFMDVTINKDCHLRHAVIDGNCSFNNAFVDGDVSFSDGTIGKHLFFHDATIKMSICCDNTTINGNLSFYDATINREAYFNGATINGLVFFEGLNISKELNFKDTIFKNPNSQEKACRKAKQVYEELGDKSEAEEYYYREMVGKRLQKPYYKRYLELIIQYCFGYGVYPYRLVITWVLIVIPLAFIYWLGNGIQDANTIWSNLYFSVVTALTPGYSGYKPINSLFQILATGEAIFGAFMWGAFIVTFARKYLR
ncbi:pentapeptide repeat-containing protein [Methanobacterium spitsbergense]|uniref:Pentapeptide repeat-containing protein n=1 Tax=Methanobacterium spitsbergense TaxID=2874285 RepID=A0A8T5UNI3_9EURY|nr:pentapeptide repeat-containing protein [Methanobacterium spitsbergense]MBZ2165214.1 pentapeptide repeat-containing protein [Methanobacterium spitsbergense]